MVRMLYLGQYVLHGCIFAFHNCQRATAVEAAWHAGNKKPKAVGGQPDELMDERNSPESGRPGISALKQPSGVSNYTSLVKV